MDEDTTELIYNIETDPNNFINSEKPIIKQLAQYIIKYNNINKHYIEINSTTSLVNMKRFYDNKISNLGKTIIKIIDNQNSKINNLEESIGRMNEIYSFEKNNLEKNITKDYKGSNMYNLNCIKNQLEHIKSSRYIISSSKYFKNTESIEKATMYIRTYQKEKFIKQFNKLFEILPRKENCTEDGYINFREVDDIGNYINDIFYTKNLLEAICRYGDVEELKLVLIRRVNILKILPGYIEESHDNNNPEIKNFLASNELYKYIVV